MSFYKNKKVLVAGGTGLIGKPLVDELINKEAIVRVASLDNASRAHPKTEFKQIDLTKYENCRDACEGMDFIFNLLCIKGSPKTVNEKPASLFTPLILFNTNLMKAAKDCNASRYLYTSSLGVYPPAEVFYEDNVWNDFPSKNDRFAGTAKLMGELQAEAYRIEYNWDNISIVRPANTYGPYDDFNSEAAMVVPSLIKKVLDGQDPLVIWGDGSQIRDFVYSEDVAKGMTLAMERGINKPMNLGSGTGYTIKNLVEVITDNVDKKPELKYDISKPSGDKKRVMDISRANSLMGWKPRYSLEQGIEKTMNWYKKNKNSLDKRYDSFKD
jgi:GDP-L-fucose synthase